MDSVKDFEPKFRVVSELQQLGEQAFIHKLKKRNPGISDSEIAEEVAKWYLAEPYPDPEKGFVRRTTDIKNIRGKN